MRQTFNLTKGGKGDPAAVWQALEARSEMLWQRAKLYLEDYFADPENGDLRVPNSYVAPDGFRLGRLVSSIRSKGCFVKGHPDRLAWLKERGWAANELDAKWEDVQPYLQDYFADEGDLRVPQSYVSPDGFRLGQLVSSIRSQGIYVKGHPDRLAWLEEKGWVASERDAKWEDVQMYFEAFFNDPKNGHLRVPISYVALDGFPLGKRVIKIRSQGYFVKGHPDRLAWLKERGFQMHARDPVKNAARWAALEA